MFCYKCGNQLEDDAVFCPLCGAKNDEEENQPSVKVNDNYYAPPRAKKGVPWKIIIPSAVIAAAVIVVFAFGRNRNVDNISTADISSGTNVVTTEYAEDNFSAEKITATAQTEAQTEAQTAAPTTTAATTTTASPTTTTPVHQKVKIGDKMYDPNMTGELDLNGENLTNSDIVNLQYMTNITSLDLGFNKITDISPLSELTNLEELKLYENSISDISPLSKLTNLEYLNLNGNRVSGISPLSKLTNLERLYLVENRISDISPISELTNLETLYIDGDMYHDSNSISDISPLSNLTKLKELDLDYNIISDVSPLSNLTNLETLSLMDNSISDISPLSKLTKLKSIKITPYGNCPRINSVSELNEYLSENTTAEAE